jgi:hypothetical protein
LELVVKSLNHYSAYLVAKSREDGRYKELAERIQRKGPAKEQPTQRSEKRKKA